MELSIWALITIVSLFMYLIFVKNNEYIKIINNYANRIKSLEDEIDSLKKIIEKSNISLLKKEHEFALFSSTKYNYPFPFWIKDSNGTMMYVNKAYEKAFNVSKSRYIGNKDESIWGIEKAKEFRKGDLEARDDPKGYKIFSNECDHYHVVKWCNKVGEIVIADYGCCFPKV